MNASNVPKYICDKSRHTGDTDNNWYITALFFSKEKKNLIMGQGVEKVAANGLSITKQFSITSTYYRPSNEAVASLLW